MVLGSSRAWNSRRRSLVREPRSRCRPEYGSAGTAKISPSSPKTVQSPWLAGLMLGSGYLPSGSGPTARSMTARVSNDEAVRSAQAPPRSATASPHPGSATSRMTTPTARPARRGSIVLCTRCGPAFPTPAIASRGPRSTVQHWTAPISGHHLERDTLVMRRSGSIPQGGSRALCLVNGGFAPRCHLHRPALVRPCPRSAGLATD
jgi:hypothetical protein